MSDILDKILAVKADEVAKAKAHRSLASLRGDVESDSALRADLRGFEASLRQHIAAGKPGIIAEVKKASGEMMLGNLNAFGPEANFSYPPKPAGNAAWNIDWTAKVRFRSHTMLLIGTDFGGMGGSSTGGSTPIEPAKKKKCKGPLGLPLPDGAC